MTWNKAKSLTANWSVLLQGHVARWIRDEVDRYVVARRRGSQEDADREFRQVGRAPEIRRDFGTR